MKRRNTQQQSAIRKVFEAAQTPLSSREVLSLAKKKTPGVSQATVYRAIRIMREKGEIVEVPWPGQETIYELSGKHHHHFFRCRGCRKMYEVKGCGNLLKNVVPQGFQLEEHEVYLQGLCAGCGE